MRVFKVTVDDGKRVFTTYSAAENKEALLEAFTGGKVIKSEDVTLQHLNSQSPDRLFIDLRRTGWGPAETALITEMVREHVTNRR